MAGYGFACNPPDRVQGLQVNPPYELSFIAGYSIEPVFATFDAFAEKFRR